MALENEVNAEQVASFLRQFSGTDFEDMAVFVERLQQELDSVKSIAHGARQIVRELQDSPKSALSALTRIVYEADKAAQQEFRKGESYEHPND